MVPTGSVNSRLAIAVLAPFPADRSTKGSLPSRLWRNIKAELGERQGLFLGKRSAALNVATAVTTHTSGLVVAVIDKAQSQEVRTNLQRRLVEQRQAVGECKVMDPVALAALRQPVHLLETHGIARGVHYHFDYRKHCLAAKSSVTLLHHTVSYRSDLYETFIPLVLGGARPYDSIVCSSNAARTSISNLLQHPSEYLGPRHKFTGRLETIPYCVDDAFYTPVSKERGRQVFGIAKDKFVYLMFGRISVADKADLMPPIIAFALLRRSLPEEERAKVLLVIAGNGRDGYTDALRMAMRSLRVEDAIQFIHGVSEEKKTCLYSSADVFMSLSDNLQECFGLTLAEAMACGVPQIVSDWSGYREVVVHGKTGLVVKTIWGRCDGNIMRQGAAHFGQFQYDQLNLAQSVCVDVKELVGSMKCLLDNAEMRSEMRRNSLLRARHEFSGAVMASRLNDLWKESEKMMASETGGPSDASLSPPSFFQVFSHFASKTTSNDMLIRPSLCALDAGMQVLGWPYAHLYQGLEPTSGWDLGRSLALLSSRCEALSLGHALELLGELDEETALRQILWLMKYGWLEEV